MAEAQIELTPEEEARIKWEQLLRGKPTVVDEPMPVEELVELAVEEALPVVIDNGPEAVLARLYKSMVAA
tara:strand:- start:20841 stop:21050 length:210 start_codon:yes stop_codon:yes gene_type:complete